MGIIGVGRSKGQQSASDFLSSSGDDMNLVMAINLGRMILAKAVSDGSADGQDQAVLRRTYTFGTISPSVLTHKGLTFESGHFGVIYGQEKLELGKMNSEFYGH